MNELVKFLFESIIGEQTSKKVVVYSGRFQPFHKGHYATYQYLVKKFGKENVYIGTSDKTDSIKSPFNFKEKKYIITTMFGIPSNKIVKIKNPYAPTEILDKFDSKTTAFITAVGEKDEMRLGGKYFEKYKDGVDLEGYMDKGYVFISPSQSNPISGTDVRNWLGKGDSKQRKIGFMKAYPTFDEKVFKLITLTLNKITKESLTETTLGGYGADEGEPATMYIPDGTKRILDKGKPEPWFKQLGYTQMDKPKADAMRGKGKAKDKESSFRKVYYKVSNMVTSDLKPVEKPKGVDSWKKIKEDHIPGGLAKGKTLIDLANKWDPKGYYDETQFAREYIKPKLMSGIKVEMEHTTDVRIATEIAMDHLWEDINYYEKLAKIENPTNEDLNPNEVEMIDGIVDLLNQVKDIDNRREMAINTLKDFDEEEIDVDREEFLKRCGINSLNESLKWEEDTYKKCMLGKLPLTLNIVKQLVEPIKTTSLHATDVENLPKVAALQGTKKSISTFNKIDKYGKIAQGKAMHTKGGIIVALSGVVLAQSIMDLWTEPDSRGLRWVEPGTIIDGLGRERDVVFNFAPELKKYKENWKQHSFDGTITNAEKHEFIQKYIDAAYKYMLSKKKQFQDIYLNSNKLYYDSEWNEVVLTQIKVEKILAIPFVWDGDENEIEKELKQLKQKYSNVEVATKESDIHNFIKQNGGYIRESVNESTLLTEGGAYGHMNHPFDIEMNLTFGDLKRIVKQALSGKLELAREKTDGQALAVSWVNGRLVAARNKSHLKNKGKDAMSVQDVISKFAGRGSVSDAFSFAIKDLESAIKGLSETNKKKIFKDGKCFMNCEIIYPENTNVIPYGQSLLVFHGTMEYNEEGTAIGENSESGAQLAAMIKKINADVQSKFKLQGPPIQKLPVNKDLKAKQSQFLNKIQSLQSEFGLTDKNGVADYHQAWWKQFIEKNTNGLDEQQKIGLVKRWAFGDKGFRIKDIKDDKNREWAEKIEKQDQQKITKENLLKFETIFLGVGAEVLSFMTSVLTVNPDAAKQQMVGRLETAVNSIKATGDAKNLDKLEIELARIEALGGFEKIVPNEGIVFNYKGNTYKLTGAFAPLNQILGIFTFSR